MRRLTLKREVNGVGTGCAGDIDQLGGVLRLVVMRVFLTGTQHLTHRDSGAGCARQETLAPMKNDTPNNSPGEPSTVGGLEFMKAPVEVQQHDTEAQIINASSNPPSSSTATSDGPVRKPSQSNSPGERPTVPTAEPPAEEQFLHALEDLLPVIHLNMKAAGALFSVLRRHVAELDLNPASQVRSCTPCAGERPNER